MRPKKARTQRTTYVDDAKISYRTSYSKNDDGDDDDDDDDDDESFFETKNRQSKQVIDRLPFPRWSLMRPVLLGGYVYECMCIRVCVCEYVKEVARVRVSS